MAIELAGEFSPIRGSVCGAPWASSEVAALTWAHKIGDMLGLNVVKEYQ